MGLLSLEFRRVLDLIVKGTYVMETQCCDNGVFERPMLRTPAGKRDGPNGKESLEGGNDYYMFG